MIVKCKGSKTIRTKSDVDFISNRIFSRLKLLLHQMDACTEVDKNSIKFKRNLRYYTPTGENRTNSIKLLREGEIHLIRLEENKLKLVWEVKLDSIAFISMMIGVLTGITLNFVFQVSPVAVVFFTMLILFSVFIIGRHFIMLQMDDLIETSCNM